MREGSLGDVLHAACSVAQAEALLGVRVGAFTRAGASAGKGKGPRILRTLASGYTLPDDLQGRVAAIDGLHSFPLTPRAPQPPSPESDGPFDYRRMVHASDLSRLYNLGAIPPVGAGSPASQAVVEFGNQESYLDADLAAFQSAEGLKAQPVRSATPPNVANDTANPAGVEASLDVQYIMATGAGVPTDVYMYEHGFKLLAFADYVLGLKDPPLVWSVSYGEGVNGGIGGRQSVEAVRAFDQEMQKLAVLGISVLVSSGDSGVYDRIIFEVREARSLHMASIHAEQKFKRQRAGEPQRKFLTHLLTSHLGNSRANIGLRVPPFVPGVRALGDGGGWHHVGRPKELVAGRNGWHGMEALRWRLHALQVLHR